MSAGEHLSSTVIMNCSSHIAAHTAHGHTTKYPSHFCKRENFKLSSVYLINSAILVPIRDMVMRQLKYEAHLVNLFHEVNGEGDQLRTQLQEQHSSLDYGKGYDCRHPKGKAEILINHIKFIEITDRKSSRVT